MRKATANAIKALLRMDATVTREMRMGIVGIIAAGDVKGAARAEVSVSEAAALLGLSHVTVWQMCKDGRLAYSKRGKKMFIRRDAVEAMRQEVA